MATAEQATKQLRVTFVHCPDPAYADTQNYGAQFMPVWAYTLASHIPQNGRFTLQLHDTRVQTLDDVPASDVFLFSGINQDHGNLMRVRAQLKALFPDAVSIIGGPICWSFNQAGDVAKLEGFDHIFIGDGEEQITELLESVRTGVPLDPVIQNKTRFDLSKSRHMFRPLMDPTIHRYYGAVLEVSRGCPFLCEFCDIRILPDNNRSHVKSPQLLIEELDHLCKLGVRQVLLACDNFIGDPKWANEVLDALLEWQARTGNRPSLYTWLTINLYKQRELMRKMRRAGFDMVFIGVESFNANSLLETAKVQNAAVSVAETVREIQSYGFIVVGGLIFGFDSDDDAAFDITLQGLLDAGMLSGDPSLLTALPGTPLHRRMKLAGRLRDVRYGLGGFKYQTNIKYLMPTDKMIAGYKYFVEQFCTGRKQYARLKVFFDNLDRGNFVPIEGAGYGNVGLFLKMILRNPAATKQMLTRLFRFASRPRDVYWALRGLGLALSRRRRVRGALGYFQFWFFAWTNSVLKYRNLSARDFDIASVEGAYGPEH
ncbi:MAG: B12-binding domain-containing radical SAM protein, partial [Candidatus Eremiobacteraeota bacterium]|nr:B12-binding domain-containing radical SAM protein [Candidatus Eremiobacteraeota bacterium]